MGQTIIVEDESGEQHTAEVVQEYTHRGETFAEVQLEDNTTEYIKLSQ